MKTRCKNCGASFDESLVKCPYCGTTYVPAAEKEYMDKLEGIRKDVAELSDDGEEEARSSAKKTLKIIIITMVIAFSAFALFYIIGRTLKQRYENEYLNDMKQRYFNELSSGVESS